MTVNCKECKGKVSSLLPVKKGEKNIENERKKLDKNLVISKKMCIFAP